MRGMTNPDHASTLTKEEQLEESKHRSAQKGQANQVRPPVDIE